MLRRAAVVTVSDRCAAGLADDVSGARLVASLAAAGFAVDAATIVPDGAARVEQAIRTALAAGARVVLTTGGTGVTPRDQTPEGTRPVLDRELPGLAEAIRARGAAVTPMAVLSRGLAGVTTGAGDPTSDERSGGAVVVNLPGSPGGVGDGWSVLAPLLDHLVDQLDAGDHR